METVDDTATGVALRAVTDLLPHYGQVVVRLDTAQRTAVIEDHLDQLGRRGVVAAADVVRLRSLLTGDGGQASEPPAPGGRPGPLQVHELLRAALLAPAAVDAGGFLDTLWDAAVTLFGVIVGDTIAGPPGAAAGGLAAHAWAQEHPPSTWFE